MSTEGAGTSFEVKTVAAYKTRKKDEISFKKGVKITVTRTDQEAFRYWGSHGGKEGWFPCLYAKPMAEMQMAEEPAEVSRLRRMTHAPHRIKEKMPELHRTQMSDASHRLKEKLPEIHRPHHHNPHDSDERTFDASSRSTRAASIAFAHLKGAFGGDKTASPGRSPHDTTEKLHEQHVLKAGPLERLSNGKTLSYWVALRSLSITFYPAAGSEKCLGKIFTKQISKLRADKEENGLFWFVVHVRRKRFPLAAHSAEERNHWIHLITLASTSEDATSAVEASQRLHKEAPTAVVKMQPKLKRMSRLDVIKRGQENLIKQVMESGQVQDAVEAEERGRTRKRFSRALSHEFHDEEMEAEGEPLGAEGTAPKAHARVQALASYLATEPSQLSFRQHDILVLHQCTQPQGWWFGQHHGRYGFFPSSYVRLIRGEAPPARLVPTPAPRPPLIKSHTATGEMGGGASGASHPLEALQRAGSMLEVEGADVEGQVGGFVLQDQIGRTAYGGIKYTAEHHAHKYTAAVLQFPRALFSAPERNAIIRKINQMASLRHPNLVGHKGVIRTRSYFNVITSYVPGESLEELVERHGPFSENRLLPYLYQVLQALQALQSQTPAIIHGRVRASNIIVDRVTHCAILGEQGFLDVLERDSTRRPLSDTHWLAPEVLRNETPTIALDIWAVGCMVLELLTGAPPFGERSPVEAAYGMVEEGPRIPEASISYAMRRFLLLCFQPQPWCRPTANELLSHPVFRPLSGDDEMPETDKDDDEEELPEDADHDDDDNDLEEPEDTKTSPEEDAPSTDPHALPAGDSSDPEFQRHQLVSEELVEWLNAALREGEIKRAVMLRKGVRDKRKELRPFREEPRYDEMRTALREVMLRCEEEIGEHLPLDSDSDSGEFSDDWDDEFVDDDDDLFF